MALVHCHKHLGGEVALVHCHNHLGGEVALVHCHNHLGGEVALVHCHNHLGGEVALVHCHKHLGGEVALVHCHNQRLVTLVNLEYSRAPHIMDLLRCLFKARYQVELWVVQIPGIEKTPTGVIRNNMHYFFAQAPRTNKTVWPFLQHWCLFWSGRNQTGPLGTWPQLFRNRFLPE